MTFAVLYLHFLLLARWTGSQAMFNIPVVVDTYSNCQPPQSKPTTVLDLQNY